MRVVKFKCKKCGAMHVFSETEKGWQVALPIEKEKSDDEEREKKHGNDFFDFLKGEEHRDNPDDEK